MSLYFSRQLQSSSKQRIAAASSVARKRGLRYERKVTECICAKYSFAIPQLTICDTRSNTVVAIPDILLPRSSSVCCVEVKYSFTRDALMQLEKYEQLLLQMQFATVQLVCVCQEIEDVVSEACLKYFYGLEALTGVLSGVLNGACLLPKVSVCLVRSRELGGRAQVRKQVGGNLGSFHKADPIVGASRSSVSSSLHLPSDRTAARKSFS